MKPFHSTPLLLAAVAMLIPTGQVFAWQAEVPGTEVPVPDTQIASAGLKVEWFSQVPVGAADRLIDWELVVDENQSTTSFEVTAGDRREVIWETDRNAFGQPYGIEGARNQANVRKDVITAELKFEGVENPQVEVKQYTRPTSTIYTLTGNGEAAAIDADTGQIRWLVQVGNRRFPCVGLGASHKHVAAVNGSTIYCLDAASGKVLWSHACKYSVGASPSVTEERIVAPLADGRLQAFDIEAHGVGTYSLVAHGEGTAQPLVTETSISWPTIRGDLNVVIGQKSHRISYRLQADAAIMSSAVAAGGMLFVGSLDGYLYAIDEDRGSVAWETSLGESISQSPIALAGFVYVISDDNKLYKLDAKTGKTAPGWSLPFPEVKNFVGAGKKTIYLMNQTGHLIGVDRASKSRRSSTRIGAIDMILHNAQSDRLYVGNHRGMVQCLREINSPRPFFHGDEVAASESTTGEEDASEDTPATNPFDRPSSNPFDQARSSDDSSSDNPFGGQATSDRDTTDDPFAAASSSDDPMAAQSETNDPFANEPSAEDPAAEPLAEDPFATQPSAEDPFATEPSAEDPFAN